MTDSDKREALAEKHERNRKQRLEHIKQWAAYIRSEPPERWGPQLNSLVDSQLEAARNTGLSAKQRKRIERISRTRSEE